MAKTLVINLFAGPGAGKSTCAWRLAGELTRQGHRVEYVSEYAKELLWDERLDLLDGSLEHQQMIFEEQNHRIQRLQGKADIIVVDSPLLFSSLYCKEYSKEFDQQVREAFFSHKNFNLFVNRGNEYDQVGRMQTHEESLAVDRKIINYLHSHSIFFATYDRDDIDRIVQNIETTFNRISRPEPVQKEETAKKISPEQIAKAFDIKQGDRVFIETTPSPRPKLIKYDLDAMREIPVNEVLADYGIKLERGNFFKIRNERTASVKYYPQNNSWYDFGINEGGGAIELVMALDNISRGEAIQKLGKQYHIRELHMPANAERFNWLTNSEFQLIGIDAKHPLHVPENPYSSYTKEQTARLQEAMNLPMNELLEKSPEQYKAVLETVAFPYVRSQQIRYYSCLDSLAVAEKKHGPNSLEIRLFQETAKQDFDEYQKIYMTLRNSAYNVRLDISQFKPDFDHDLSLARQKRLKIEIGDYPYSEYRKLPGINIYQKVSRECYDELKNQLHDKQLTIERPFSAFLQDGKVNLVYKSPDKEFFDDLIRGVDHYLSEIKPELLKQKAAELNIDLDNFKHEKHEPDMGIER